MIKNILLIGLTFFKGFITAQNFSITYGFPDVSTLSGQTDPSISPVFLGLNCGAFNAIGTSANPNASGRFSYTGWPTGANNNDDNYGNYTAALSPSVYYETTLSVNSGYTLNLISLHFDVRRSGTGIRTYCVRSSLDNFTNNLAASTGTNSKLEVIPNDIFFWKYDSISTNNDQRGSRVDFNAAFSALSGSVTFRFYAWNAEANTGAFSLDNVNFAGILSSTLNLSGIHEEQSSAHPAGQLSVFPNPCFNGKLSLETHFNIEKVELESEIAEKIRIESADPVSYKKEVDVSALGSGIYFLKVFGEDQVLTKKILIRP